MGKFSSDPLEKSEPSEIEVPLEIGDPLEETFFILPPEAIVWTELSYEGDTLTVHSANGERIVFDVAALAQRLRRERKSWNSESENQPITLDGTSESGRLTVRLHFTSITGELVDGAPEVDFFEGTILWRENQSPR